MALPLGKGSSRESASGGGPSLPSRLKALVFILVLLLTSAVGTLCVNGILMPLLLFRPRLYRLLFDLFIGLWEWQAAGLLEKFIGMKVEITGDEIQCNEQNVIIMNHRTCFDWLYCWSLLLRQSGLWTHKTVVKSPLRHLPGPGWAMQCAAYLFVNRRWEDDEKHLGTMIKYFAKLDYKTQILIFPEGTDYNVFSKQRSDAFAAKQGLKPLSYVLHPRTTGFSFLVSQLQQCWKDLPIYDVTIAFPSSFPQNEVELVKGILPSSVHFHVRRYSPADIPRTVGSLSEWCTARWEEKEKRLRSFYENGRFVDAQHNEGSRPQHRNRWLDICLYVVMLSWYFGTAFVILAVFWWPLLQVVFLAEILLFVGLWYWGSGFDVIQGTSAFINRKQ